MASLSVVSGKNYKLKSICVNIWMLGKNFKKINKEGKSCFPIFSFVKNWFLCQKEHGSDSGPYKYATVSENMKNQRYKVVFPSSSDKSVRRNLNSSKLKKSVQLQIADAKI